MTVQKMNAPFWIARLVALLLTFAWAMVDIGLAINARIKSNNLINQFTQEMPPAIVPYLLSLFDPNLKAGINVSVNDQDISQAGTAVICIAAVTALACALIALFHALRRTASPMALRIQGAILGLCTVGLFAAMIPYTLFYQTRGAIIGVSAFSLQVPQSIVKTVQDVLGLPSQYDQLDFLQLLAIFPWITVIFSLVTTAMLFVAASRVYTKPQFRDWDEKVPATKPADKGVGPGPGA